MLMLIILVQMTSLPQTTQRTCLRQKHTATPAQRLFSVLHFTLHDDDLYDKDGGHLLERRNMPRESPPCWMCPLHPLHSRCTVAFKIIIFIITWLVFILIMLQNVDKYDTRCNNIDQVSRWCQHMTKSYSKFEHFFHMMFSLSFFVL